MRRCPPRFSIAHVTPYPWEAEDNEVNAHVARVAAELSRARASRAGARAVALAGAGARLAQGAARRARERGASALLDGTDGGTPRVIAVGEVLDVRRGARRRAAAAVGAADRRRAHGRGTAEHACELDFVHVHEPFAPSTSNAALRHSRALNVGSFHSSSERLLSTLVARRFVESFFGRLDARTASLPATAELMARHFPGDYRLVRRRRATPPTSSSRSTARWPRAATRATATRRSRSGCRRGR